RLFVTGRARRAAPGSTAGKTPARRPSSGATLVAMRRAPEGASVGLRALFAVALTLACGAARAQAPTCAWGEGVALPGGDTREVLITDDGAAGVLAITWKVNIGAVFVSSLQFFHVLEQGELDPSLPAAGVTIVTGADLPAKPEFIGVRACSDGA